MDAKTQVCITAYKKHKHLQRAAAEINIPWQTVYIRLRQAGVPVVGDKSRYGSPSDRLAAKAEREFQSIVPFAVPMNEKRFQSKIDFKVGAFGVDVKCGRLKRDRWMFSIKKQEAVADFFVCFAMSNGERVADCEFMHTLLIPGEIARKYSTISLSNTVSGKWWGYYVSNDELVGFFRSMERMKA